MFKPFDLDFKEYPYIDIKIGEGCPAACTDCRFNIDYIVKAKQFSLANILKRIKEVDRSFDKRFNLVFGNQDGLNHKDIINILKSGLETGREIRFQIDFDIKKEHIDLLEKIQDELGYERIDIKIAKNARKVNLNLGERLLVLIKLLSKNTRFKIFIDLFIDFAEYKNLIEVFSKKFSVEGADNKYDFYIGDNINLKFHNYSWKLDRENKCFINLEREYCQQLEQLYTKAGDIFLKDSLDVYDNGDLFIHDNLCNIGDIRISNLYLDDEQIYNHFNEYLQHLNSLKHNSQNQSEMCYKCIKKGFKYKKI